MSDYTPNTDVIRQAVTFERNRLGEPRTISAEKFDRWLAAHDAGVASTAWKQGHLKGFYAATPLGIGNPYRKTEPEGKK